ncbi:MAG: PqqD family protein [Bacteroidales bacterium]|nr:PqqD family protein [Bacteroidales bacterium]
MLKYSIEMAPLGAKYVVAAKDPEKGTVEQVFTLNETAAYMLRLFSEGLDAEAVTNRIATEYGAPYELVKRDVDSFWEDIVSKGLV